VAATAHEVAMQTMGAEAVVAATRHEEALAAAHSQHKLVVEQQETENTTRVEDTRAAHEAAVEELRREGEEQTERHAEHVLKERLELEARHEQACEVLISSHSEKELDVLRMATEAAESHAEQQQVQHEEHEVHIQELSSAHGTKADELAASHTGKLRDAVRRAVVAQKAADREKAETADLHEVAVAELAAAHSEQQSLVRREQEEVVDTLRVSHKRMVAQQADLHNEHVQSLKSANAVRVDNFVAVLPMLFGTQGSAGFETTR